MRWLTPRKIVIAAALGIAVVVSVLIVVLPFSRGPAWQSGLSYAGIFSAVLGGLAVLIYLIRDDNKEASKVWRNPANTFVIRLAAISSGAAGAYLFVIAVLPIVMAALFGGITDESRMVATNVYGGLAKPTRGCRFPLPVVDEYGELTGRAMLCAGGPELVESVQSMGNPVLVSIHGWGNDFGVFYWWITPIKAVPPKS
ncbi:MAG: hypothetical protein WCC57_11865 [Paracoccaceae bacterium]